jgi:hypothetical protein
MREPGLHQLARVVKLRGLPVAFLAMASLAWAALLPSAAFASSGEQPTIASSSASSITASSAALEANIDPEGLETRYEIWIGYAVCQNTPPGDAQCEAFTSYPVGEGEIAPGNEPQTVRVDIAGLGPDYRLEPNYLYYYWVRASSSAGYARGPTQSFRTLSEEPGLPLTPNPGAPSPETSTGGAEPLTGGTFGGGAAPPASVQPGTSLQPSAPGSSSAPSVEPRALTMRQQLVRALRACARRPRSQRVACEKRAHKRYDLRSYASQTRKT